MTSDVEVKNILQDLINKFVNLLSTGSFGEVVRKTINDNYAKGMDQSENQFNMNFFQDSEKIQFLEKYTFDNIKGMNDELAEKLRKELSQGLFNMESVSKLQKRVSKVMDVGIERAKMIAVTEANRAENMGSLDGARQSGLKLMKQWDAHLDKKTSPVCAALNGKTIPLDDKFVYKGQEFEAPPAHPNCRSTLVYVHK